MRAEDESAVALNECSDERRAPVVIGEPNPSRANEKVCNAWPRKMVAPLGPGSEVNLLGAAEFIARGLDSDALELDRLLAPPIRAQMSTLDAQ